MRQEPKIPSVPEASNRMLLGSGTVGGGPQQAPPSVNASEGIVPTEFSDAIDGPEVSSQ